MSPKTINQEDAGSFHDSNHSHSGTLFVAERDQAVFRALSESEIDAAPGQPGQIAGEVISGRADMGIATESLVRRCRVDFSACYEWHHCFVTPLEHPLLAQGSISLFDIGRYPIITYDTAFAGRSKINRAFEQQGVTPNIILSALDADVIKAYVALGLGIGIVAKMAFEPARDTGLCMIEIDDLFPLNTTRIAFRRDGYLRALRLRIHRIVRAAFDARDG